MCASMPWGNAEQKSGDFVAHINLRHKFEYERFVVSVCCFPQLAIVHSTAVQPVLFSFLHLLHQDFAKDDDEQLRVALEKSKISF